MLCYDAILAETWIFKGMSQLSDIKSVHWSIIPLTAHPLLSPSSYPAVNADLWWRNTVSENRTTYFTAIYIQVNGILKYRQNVSW